VAACAAQRPLFSERERERERENKHDILLAISLPFHGTPLQQTILTGRRRLLRLGGEGLRHQALLLLTSRRHGTFDDEYPLNPDDLFGGAFESKSDIVRVTKWQAGGRSIKRGKDEL
jgi:hypothetical protein